MARKFVTVQCKLCGKDTQKPPSLLKWRANLFCSRKCWGLHYHNEKSSREYKFCPKCKTSKPKSEYHSNKRNGDGLQGYCIECFGEINRNYVKKYKPLVQERQKRYFKNNRELIEDKRIQSRHGITASERGEILRRQNGLCAICKSKPAIHIDHDHVTNKVRGLLCNNCNTGLGMFHDNISFMATGIKYLENNRD